MEQGAVQTVEHSYLVAGLGEASFLLLWSYDRDVSSSGENLLVQVFVRSVLGARGKVEGIVYSPIRKHQAAST